jgi:bla regulator protein blaR1
MTMIPRYLAAIAPALGNHLWQSTIFAGVAGLLTLVLRRNHAGARYWLWLAASLKFLIPFSLLAGIGSHLALARGSAGTKAGWYFAMEELSGPFTQPKTAVISRATSPTPPASLMHALPALLAAIWLCGFVAVLIVCYLRWRRISAAMREAVPLREGREVAALRRLELLAGMLDRIGILLSRTSLEPGIFGIARPVLIWPQGISERLENAHIEAILAHELCHVRRRDNLAAATHMVVEGIFWFHPLVWWLGARLVAERERACDEEVLESGSDRQVYAESILKICEFCVGSPLACVSGVTGSDLQKRIVRIMTECVARKLDFGRKLLLSAAGFVALVAPIVFGLLNATPIRAQSQTQNAITVAPAYTSISIKPSALKPDKSGIFGSQLMFRRGQLTATYITVQDLIREAYGVDVTQISGAPNYVTADKYDIEAKMDGSAADAIRKLSPDQRELEMQRMLQTLLADRFKLTLHRETKDLPVYEMVIAENGPHLQEAKPGDTYPNGIKGPDGRSMPGLFRGGPGELTGQGVPIGVLAKALTQRLGRNVLDKTGLAGNYDFTLRWTPNDGGPAPDNTVTPESSGSAAIFAAIQEQLGLKLEPQSAPIQILVIDHVEQPSEN